MIKKIILGGDIIKKPLWRKCRVWDTREKTQNFAPSYKFCPGSNKFVPGAMEQNRSDQFCASVPGTKFDGFSVFSPVLVA